MILADMLWSLSREWGDLGLRDLQDVAAWGSMQTNPGVKEPGHSQSPGEPRLGLCRGVRPQGNGRGLHVPFGEASWARNL